MLAAAGLSLVSWLSGATGASLLSGLSGASGVAQWALGSLAAVVAGLSGLSLRSWGSATSVGSGSAGLALLSRAKDTRGAVGSGSSISAGLSGGSARSGSTVAAGGTTVSGATRVSWASGLSVVSSWSLGAWRSVARALFSRGSVCVGRHGSGRSLVADLSRLSWHSVTSIGSGLSSLSGGTVTAGAATVGLTGLSLAGSLSGEELGHAGLAAALAVLRRRHLHHLLPHLASARLAEVQLHLDGALQGLDVGEDQREGDKASRDGDRAEHDGREGRLLHRLARGLLVHLLGLLILFGILKKLIQ